MLECHEIVMANVGQGDCTACQLRNGQIFLIDCNWPSVSRHRPPAIIAHLERFAKRRISLGLTDTPFDIELLCLSHPDRDHYLGLVLQRYK